MNYQASSRVKVVEGKLSGLVNPPFGFSIDENSLQSSFWNPSNSKLDLVKHSLVFEGVKCVNYFDEKYSFKPLNKAYKFPAYNFLAIEIQMLSGEFLYFLSKKPFPGQIRVKRNVFTLDIIHDAPFLHPTWFFDKGVKKPKSNFHVAAREMFEAGLSYLFSKKRFDLKLPIFYPNKLSCFILTDHCDFDTTQKLSDFLTLNEFGLLNQKLKITKGVFRYSPMDDEVRKSDDLEIDKYQELIRNLYSCGSEIAPHALKHSGTLSDVQVNEGLQYLKEKFDSSCWIDHGSYSGYCYSSKKDPISSGKFIDLLRSFGFTSLWSYTDLPFFPFGQINIMGKSRLNLCLVLKVLKYIFKGKILVLGHVLRTFLKYFLFSYEQQVDYSFVKLKNFKRRVSFLFFLISSPFYFIYFFVGTIRSEKFDNSIFVKSDLCSYAGPVFLSSLKSINNFKKGDLVFFNTIETTNINLSFSVRNLRNLVSSNGICIAHTYILNNIDYIDGVFNKNLSFSVSWEKFLSEYSILADRIWNPTMSQFSNRILSILNCDLLLDDNGITIINNNSEEIRDFTFIDKSGQLHLINIPGAKSSYLDF